MTVTTKYNVGDSVWIMSGNRPTQKVVYKITVTASESINIHYYFHITEKVSTLEKYMFKTKEDLINSL